MNNDSSHYPIDEVNAIEGSTPNKKIVLSNRSSKHHGSNKDHISAGLADVVKNDDMALKTPIKDVKLNTASHAMVKNASLSMSFMGRRSTDKDGEDVAHFGDSKFENKIDTERALERNGQLDEQRN